MSARLSLAAAISAAALLAACGGSHTTPAAGPDALQSLAAKPHPSGSPGPVLTASADCSTLTLTAASTDAVHLRVTESAHGKHLGKNFRYEGLFDAPVTVPLAGWNAQLHIRVTNASRHRIYQFNGTAAKLTGSAEPTSCPSATPQPTDSPEPTDAP